MKGNRFLNIKLLLGLCFAVFFTVTLSIASAQSAPEIEWQKVLGVSGADSPFSIQQTSDGGFIVAGKKGLRSYHNSLGGSYDNTRYDLLVVKYDESGNQKWQQCLGGSNHDYADSIQQTSDGGYIVAGLTSSNDGDVTGHHGDYDYDPDRSNINTTDYWIIRLNSVGGIEWKKCLGGLGNDEASSIQQTSDGGYIVAGDTGSNDGDVTGNHGMSDYWVVKLNSVGGIEWQKSLGGSDYDKASSIQQTSDGGYIVAGYTESHNGDVTGQHGHYNLPDIYSNTSDYWIIKLNAVGGIEWQKSLGGSGYDKAYSIQQTSDGGYIVAGSSESNDGDLTGSHGGYGWIVNLDKSGNIMWQKRLGGSASSIQQTFDFGYIIAGYSGSNYRGSDGWIVKTNSTMFNVIPSKESSQNKLCTGFDWIT